MACGRTDLDAPTVTIACDTEPPTCVERLAGCEAPRLVTAKCDVSSKVWSCPSGAKPHARVEPTSCSFDELRGSLVRVPTDDGRCLWVAEKVGVRRNIAFESEPDAPFGSCPVMRELGPLETDDRHVQITGAYRLGDATRVTYRLFVETPGAAFGVEELGTGIAKLEGTHISIPPTPRFAPDLDLGDAALVIGDHAYLYGCPGPPDFLTERCLVGRVDASDAMELFAGKWIASTRGSDGERVFDAGPWVSAVVARPNDLLHVYAVGFGSDLQTHTAKSPEGPWSNGPNLGRCLLPADDPKAFCAGPVVHKDLADPTRPGELVVSYGVGSTAGRDHASRLAWHHAP